MRLGWRNPTKGKPDLSFADLERKLMFPHVRFSVDSGQAVTSPTAAMTITAVDDAYKLIRSSTEISVPKDHEHWFAIGMGAVRVAAAAAAGRRLAEWGLNGSGLANDGMREEGHGYTAGDTSMQAVLMYPVEAGQRLTLRAFSASATTTLASGGAVLFVPLT